MMQMMSRTRMIGVEERKSRWNVDFRSRRKSDPVLRVRRDVPCQVREYAHAHGSIHHALDSSLIQTGERVRSERV
jgi:hypothetical protein